jgi:hypothetical protein
MFTRAAKRKSFQYFDGKLSQGIPKVVHQRGVPTINASTPGLSRRINPSNPVVRYCCIILFL